MALTTGEKVLHGSVLFVGATSVVLFIVMSGGSTAPPEPMDAGYRAKPGLTAVAAPGGNVTARNYSSPNGGGGGGGGGGGSGGGGGDGRCEAVNADFVSNVKQNSGFRMFQLFRATTANRTTYHCPTAGK